MNYEVQVRNMCVSCRGAGALDATGKPLATDKSETTGHGCDECGGTGWIESWRSFRDLERDLQRSTDNRAARM